MTPLAIRALCPVLLLALLGCGDDNTTALGDMHGEKVVVKKLDCKIKLAFVTPDRDDFWLHVQAGCKRAEVEFADIAVDFMVGDGTASRQQKMVADLMASGVRGFALTPSQPQEQVAGIRKWRDDVPVICVGADAPASIRSAYVGMDPAAAGRQCAELLKEALPGGGGIIALLEHEDAQNSSLRCQILQAALSGSPVNIIAHLSADSERAKTQMLIVDALKKYPDCVALVGLANDQAPLLIKAVQSAQKIGRVQIITFGDDPATLTAIDQGTVFGTIVQNPFRFGYESMRLLHQLIVENKSTEDMGLDDQQRFLIDTTPIRKGEGLRYQIYLDGLKKSLIPVPQSKKSKSY